MKSIIQLCTLYLIVIISVSSLIAQDELEDLSQTAANPIADLISFPFQNNTNFGFGEFNRTANILNIQPVIPFANGKIITRTIFPIVWLPDITAESGSFSSGLADILLTAFYVPPSKGLIWGIGPVIELPTGGEKRGTQKWSIGPSVLVLTQPENWTLGILANNVWSIAGKSERADVSKALINLFIVRQLGDGWYVNSAPLLTANWKAESGQKWVIPIGAGFGKLFRVGKLPVNAQIGAYYNVVKPDIGPKWQLRIQVQILLPTAILGG